MRGAGRVASAAFLSRDSPMTTPHTVNAAEELDPAQRCERRVDTAIAVIFAVAPLLAAWAGYQAGLRSGEKTISTILAEGQQIEATRANAILDAPA